jgi:hypothetical protein
MRVSGGESKAANGVVKKFYTACSSFKVFCKKYININCLGFIFLLTRPKLWLQKACDAGLFAYSQCLKGFF